LPGRATCPLPWCQQSSCKWCAQTSRIIQDAAEHYIALADMFKREELPYGTQWRDVEAYRVGGWAMLHVRAALAPVEGQCPCCRAAVLCKASSVFVRVTRTHDGHVRGLCSAHLPSACISS